MPIKKTAAAILTQLYFAFQSEYLMTLCIKDIGQVRFSIHCCLWEFCLFSFFFLVFTVSDVFLCLTCDQDVEKTQLDGCCQNLSKLIQDELFLTSMVHALEEQKRFNVEHKYV